MHLRENHNHLNTPRSPHNRPHPHQMSEHMCKIDLTNHDSVISGLQVKCKDLYYFWRNYEWLYHKYYSLLQQISTLQPPIDRSEQIRIQMQAIIEDLTMQLRACRQQNDCLHYQIDGLKKMLQIKDLNMENAYAKDINHLRAQISQYQRRQSQYLNEIATLKSERQSLLQHQGDKSKYEAQIKGLKLQILSLQASIDQLRSKLSSQVPVINVQSNKAQIDAIHEAHRQQIKRIKQQYRYFQQKFESLLNEEMQGAKRDLRTNLQNTLAQQLEAYVEIVEYNI